MNSAVRVASGGRMSARGSLRCEDCVVALRALGFALHGMTPIRVVLSRDGHWAYVPRHGRISEAEVGEILSAASVEREDFDRALVGIEAMRPISSTELLRVAIGPKP